MSVVNLRSSNFIRESARQDLPTYNDIWTYLKGGFTESLAQASSNANILTALVQTYATITGGTASPFGAVLTYINAKQGFWLNYAIQISEVPGDPTRATLVSLAGTLTTVAASEALTKAAELLAFQAVRSGSDPIAVSIWTATASACIVSTSAYLGNLAQISAGNLYDRYLSPKTKIDTTKEGKFIITTSSSKDIVSLFPWLNTVTDISTVDVNNMTLSEYLINNGLCKPEAMAPWKDIVDGASAARYLAPLSSTLTMMALKPRASPMAPTSTMTPTALPNRLDGHLQTVVSLSWIATVMVQ